MYDFIYIKSPEKGESKDIESRLIIVQVQVSKSHIHKYLKMHQ